MIIADQISPELSLLISACLRTPYKGDTRQIDFEKCNQLIAWHGIRPLFLSYLEKFELKFPDQDKLISECKSIAFYNLLLTKEYADIHELLRAHGILNFAYKGSYWAEWLYENSSMREFGDIDFLVAKSDVAKTLKVLKENLGYEPDDYRTFLLEEPTSFNAFLRTDYHIPMVKDMGFQKIAIEVHWQNAYPRLAFDFPETEWLTYKTEFQKGETNLNGFINEYQLLLLLVHHSGKESWEKLKYIADFTGYLIKFGHLTDWDLVQKIARKKGIFFLLLNSFQLLKVLGFEFNFSLPFSEQELKSQTPNQLIANWESMPAATSNSTVAYLKNGIKMRDGFYFKSKVLGAHLKYFMEWPLLWQKTKWYRKF